MTSLSAAERARLPKPGGQAAVWRILRQNKTRALTVTEIWHLVNAGRRDGDTDTSTVRRFCRALGKAGYVEVGSQRQRGQGGAMAKTYRLVRDCGSVAPHLNQKGEAWEHRPSGYQRLWTAMHVLKEFDRPELAMTARLNERTVREYILFLSAAGYLQEIEGASPRRWRLLPGKWTGPLSPQITHLKALYDPNLGEIVYATRRGGDEETADV